ncbi:MAG TPA: serine/threonine-protein kinase [Anaerolineae bacterium]|nr:serine/threonine-protein kinase [Anaerolineae bacterium]
MDNKNIGRYEIISEIGRGGMATVYLAKDPNFEREVAIKILPRAFLHDPQFRARFKREAKTIAALEHQSIVPVYDFGEEDEQPYIVMRLMTGGSLADKLRIGKLSIDEATKIVIRIAQALDAAHAKGVIHRDIKPGNILFDQYDNAFLTDFGIARLAEGGATLTGGTILGTPAYMSPEQVQGDKEIDGRSDIYSLGIIFYHMLTGNPPYQATTPAKIMMMHVLEPVPEIRKTLPDLPIAYEKVLLNVLAKNPDDRYSTAGDFASALLSASREEDIQLISNNKTIISSSSPVSTQKHGADSVPSSLTSPPVIATASSSRTHPPSPKKSELPWLVVSIAGIGIIGAIAILAFIFVQIKKSNATPTILTPPSTIMAIVPSTVTPYPTKIQPQDVTKPSLVLTLTYTPLPASTITPAEPTSTSQPSATETVIQASIPIIGGADKIAFLNANDLWVMNVDGSELLRLTNDGATKTGLSWLPDGSAVKYVSGNCAWSANIETGRLDFITCFETGELKAFEFSPDGKQVAISLNNELYVVPYKPELLSEARYHSDLRAMSECPVLSPLKTNTNTSVPVKLMKWSANGNKLAILILANDKGRQVDLIRIIDIKNCKVQPDRIDEFPATRFKLPGYDKTPYIQRFGWDGKFLFAINSFTRNDGFGDLFLYNLDLHKAYPKINPIEGKCCYRDADFSPDSRYLIFVYQPFEAGAKAQMYYIRLGTIGTGMQYQPISLPEDFFSNPREKPQPILRPAINQ